MWQKSLKSSRDIFLQHIEPYVYLQHVLGWQAKKAHRDSQTKVATTIAFFRFTNLANAIYQPKKTVKVKHTEKAVMAQKSQKWLEIKMQQGQWTDGRKEIPNGGRFIRHKFQSRKGQSLKKPFKNGCHLCCHMNG